MTIEGFILTAMTVIPFCSIIYIPREKARKAFLSFLAFQTTTWGVSIALVEMGKITYPFRLFAKATNVNFIPQYLFYPAIFMWFILIFPEKRSILIKVIHYFLFVSIMLWTIYFTSKYTSISHFTSSNDYLIIRSSYIRNFLQFFICHLYITWFFKKRDL